MLIQKIRVKNYRSIKDETLHLDRLTALVGRNGAGKSSFLRALEMFYNSSARMSQEDLYAKDTDQSVEITVTFSCLTQENNEAFSSYIDSDGTLSVSKVFHLGDSKKPFTYHGSRAQNPDFVKVRNAGGRRDITNKYRELRESDKYADDLPTVRSAEEASEAMSKWESEHPDECCQSRDDGQFFGFTNVGHGSLQPHTEFILVPAVHDASEETDDGRNAALRQILNLIVRRDFSSRKEVRELQTTFRERYEGILGSVQLDDLQSQITDTLTRYAPNAKVSLNWTPPDDLNIPDPKALVNLVEDNYETDISKVGHGLQRAFIMTILQVLQQTSREANQSDENTRMPNLILAIEEPELYQHPSRQRHLAAVLKELAANEGASGDSIQTQVIYTTHSPLFVGLDRIEQIRLLRKEHDQPDHPQVTTVSKTDLGEVANALQEAQSPQAPNFTAESLRPRMQAVMTPIMNEGFFADVVVLVEGEGDRAVLLAVAEGMEYSLDAMGIAVIPCGGKNSLDRPYVMFKKLRIPTYMVWDNDKGNNQGKSGAEANRRLLRLIEVNEPDAQDYPEGVEDTHACLGGNLETLLRKELSPKAFNSILTEEASAVGMSNSEATKRPSVLGKVVTRAMQQGKSSPTLKSILDRIIAIRKELD